ncbi:MFS transporter [Paramicrobacterium humi]|uniref:MFS transporter n=1 Tax=Paramicrobacterium humi TaxID=640635 RepID=UPI001FE0C258|nr:MFS transporter [Microbacterium humi]
MRRTERRIPARVPTASPAAARLATDAVEPSRAGATWFAPFAVAWLCLWTVQLTPTQLLLPLQLNTPDGADGWVLGVVYSGLVFALGGVAAIIAGPLAGTLSDRTRSRFGRRRPWMAGGIVVTAVSTAVLGLQHTVVGVAVMWVGVSAGIAVASAAYTALVADQLPAAQRGTASAVIGATQAVGIIVGVGVVIGFALTVQQGYLVLAVAILVLGLPTAALLPDEPAPLGMAESTGVRRLLSRLWVNPLAHPDFAWVIVGRVLVNIGNALGTALLLFFLMYGIDDSNAEIDLFVLIAVYTVFVVAASFAGGWLSDRLARRKVFVAIAAVFQTASALLLAGWPSLGTAMIAAALLGIGYGGFSAVGLALAADVLPAEEDHAKDLGIVTVAASAPQLLSPLLGAGLVAATGGFTLLFTVAAVASLAGALSVFAVRGAR